MLGLDRQNCVSSNPTPTIQNRLHGDFQIALNSHTAGGRDSRVNQRLVWRVVARAVVADDDRQLQAPNAAVVDVDK